MPCHAYNTYRKKKLSADDQDPHTASREGIQPKNYRPQIKIKSQEKMFKWR